MVKPVSKILLVNADALQLRGTLRGLSAATRGEANPFGIKFLGATSHQEALELLHADGEVQALLVAHSADCEALDARNLVRAARALRPELDLYVIQSGMPDHTATEHWLGDQVEGFFHADERDYRGWWRVVQAQLQKKSRTPFYDALKDYVAMANDSWHTPGHSSGDSLRGSPWVDDFHSFMGDNAFRADLSVSVDMLDSLLDPKGVIEEAQALAAQAFGAKRTYFATNGTSTANKVIFQTLLTPGDKLLLDRNCHKSVHHGVVLAGARPVYLSSSINRLYGLFGPVPKAVIFAAIDNNPDAKALILTSCTYDGLRYDLAPIIAAAHARGIKVIIDEAWFAHARFHPAFRPTALESGADYATQSTHKVLSALSQSSMIHVNDPDFDAHSFRENFNMHTSTSPQYTMIASLDVGRRQAVMEGYRLLARTLALAADLRQEINATGVFRVLELGDLLSAEIQHDGVQLDPTKITIDISKSGLTVEEFQKELFEKYHVQVEKSTFNTVSLLLTIGTTRAKVIRLLDALQRIAATKRAPRKLYRVPEITCATELHFLPRDAYYCNGELMAMIDDDEQPNPALLGRVCADQIVPYPPGIPALVPGQVITLENLRFLLGLMKSHKRTDMHGVVYDGYLPCIRVVTQTEAKSLSRLPV